MAMKTAKSATSGAKKKILKAKAVVHEPRKERKPRQPRQMNKKVWTTMMLGGVAAIVVGLLATFWPGITLEILMVVFGVFLIVMGGIWLINGLTHVKTDKLWWLGGLLGAAAVVVGIIALVHPERVLGFFATLLVIFVFAQAVMDFIIASYSKKKDQLLWIVIGFVSIVFGLVIIINPSNFANILIFLLGVYALVHGMVAVAHAIAIKDKLN